MIFSLPAAVRVAGALWTLDVLHRWYWPRLAYARWRIPWAHQAMARLVAVLLCLHGGSPPEALADELPELPSPDLPGSHEVFQQRMLRVRTAQYHELLSIYDERLQENPANVNAALERCKFILAAQDIVLEGIGDAPEPEDSAETDCTAQLLERFPNVPAVLQFRIEQLWGDEAIAFGNATLHQPNVSWTQEEKATFLRQLAVAYFAQSKLEDAVTWALRARALDTGAEVGLILASHFKAMGMRERAIQELTRVTSREQIHRSIDLLVELEAFDKALANIERLASEGTPVSGLVHARVLEGLGRSDAARAKYAELSGQLWDRHAVLERLFYLDLSLRGHENAVRAYNALRDEGYSADPVLRHRLALAGTFPTAPWRTRDLFGALGLLALCLLTAALPVAIVLPIHYVGLLRGPRVGPPTPSTERWSLWHVWALSGSLSVVGMLAAYMFAYDSLWALVTGLPSSESSTLDVARAAVWGIIGGAVVTLAWLRRDDYRRWMRGSWSLGRVLKAVPLRLLLVYAVAGIGIALIRMLGGSASDLSQAGVGLATIEVWRAIQDVYGAWALVPLMAVVVPVYEEVLFRGVFLAGMGRYLSFGWANAVQASVFALAHDQPSHYASLFVFALLAGRLTRRSGGLIAPVALHGAMNFLAALALCVLPALTNARDALAAPSRAGSPLAESIEATVARCEAGNAAACHNLGTSYLNETGVQRDPAAAAEFYRKACDGGASVGCSDLGMLHYFGTGVPKDPALAVQLFKTACEANILIGCEHLAMAYDQGRGVTRDASTSAKLLRHACERGRLSSCGHLGYSYASGDGVEKNSMAAAQLCQRACNAGALSGCNCLARLHYDGNGVPQSFEKAAHFFQKACDAGSLRDCNDLAGLYQAGQGVPKDPSVAVRLYQTACGGGRAPSCASLAHLHYHGVGVPKDLSSAAHWFRVACDGGEPWSCWQLSGMHQRGEGVALDLEMARQMFQKACVAGLQNPACTGN